MIAAIQLFIVLSAPRKILEFISYCRALGTGVTTHAAVFGKAPAFVAQLATATDELETAQQAARKRADGAIAVRNQKRVAVQVLLRQAIRFVQGVADAQPDRTQEIAQLVGMSVRKRPVRKGQAMVVRSGKHAGSVSLVAPRPRARVVHEWQLSIDGTTWLPASASNKSRTIVMGLQQGVNTHFRHRLVTKDGPQEWSQTISIFVQ